MINEIKAVVTPLEMAGIAIKAQYERLIIRLLFIFTKVGGVFYILIADNDISFIIIGIIFFFLTEVLMILLYFTLTNRYKKIFGEQIESIHQLKKDEIIYIAPKSTTTISWNEVTTVKINKRFISIYKQKVLLHRISSSKKRPENYQILKEYISDMSILHGFEVKTKLKSN